MTRYFILSSLLFTMLFFGNSSSYAGKSKTNPMTESKGHVTNAQAGHNNPAKAATQAHGAKAHQPVEKAHTPSWDELAHIHHFHKEKLKKIRRHYKKCIFMTKLLLFICHAAVLFISYLHVIH